MAFRLFRRIKKLKRDPLAYLADSRHGFLRSWGERLGLREEQRFLSLGREAAHKKISVIMTVYNTGHLVEKAIASVLAQSHKNLELLIIDDASNDDTLDTLKRLGAGDVRVRVFSSPRNHGTYWSKNWCLHQATGDYVAFHDSDDFSSPDRLRVQLGAMSSQPSLKACTCRWQRINDQGETLSIDGKAERMAAISLMIRRDDVLRHAGFFDTVRIAADTEFIQRLRHIFGWRGVRHLRQCLYTGLLRENSLTTSKESGFDWQSEGKTRNRQVGGVRAAYYQAFTRWHLENTGNVNKLKVAFPAPIRPFDVPDTVQHACNDKDLGQVIEIKQQADYKAVAAP